MSKTVLLATEKAFAAEAVTKIEAVTKAAGYTLQKLENYKSKDDLLKAVASADAMIIRSDIVDAAVVEKASKLKIVVRAGAGFDNIDLPACTSKRIVAQNTPGQNANAVAELVFGMMLTSARNNYNGESGFELVNREIAFYGFGAVARAVHKIAVGMGMKSFAYDPYVPADKIAEAGATPVKSIPELFDHQYVSLHVPLTDETNQSINKSLLSRLPKNGTLINTARHEVVHEGDILQMMKDRKDFCYLSDVCPKNAEEIKKVLGDKYMQRAIFTKKKMGAQTIEANNNAGVAAANQIHAFFEQGVTKFQLNPFPADGEPPAKRARTGRTFLFSSESVNEGHPDKICDQVSDAVLDTCLKADPKSKVACETATKDNMVMVAGEITTQAKIDYDKVVRGVVAQIGFDSFVDDLSSVDSKGLSDKTCEVLVRINKQSPDIAGGVHVGKDEMDVGAGDQGIMFGYASDETSDCMPLTHSMATRLGKTLTEVRKSGECWWLRPDGKTQVTIEYLQHDDGSVEPKKIHTVVISTQHAEPLKAKRSKECAGYKGAEMTAPSMEEMNKLIEEKVIKRTLQSIKLKNGQPAISLYGSHTHLHINPSGKFIIGGPQGDAGLTGRKIIIDTYGGWGAHGGGAFSGKDPTKVDRSAAYICRQMAKSVVNSGLSARCLVQLSYAIGVAKPLSLFVETYGSERGTMDVDDITNVLKIEFDCRPGAIAQSLALREPKYQETAAYCHFGREPYTKDGIKFFEWENAKSLSKYKDMNSAQVTAALKSSNYLAKWVD